MRLQLLSTSAALLCAGALSTSTAAQRPRVYAGPSTRIFRGGDSDQPRAALGITISGSTSARDTLGLLVASVIPNSPAERAGIEEGDRLASIDGVNLRIDPSDVGDSEASSAMNRRLTRELEKVRPGDEVDLRVYSSGETRTARVRTADSDSLYGRRRVTRNGLDERGTLGFGIMLSHSRRDTLGVLVMFVDDSGPAARAGIEEGNRIAAINDVDLRVSPEDADDDAAAMTKMRTLQREVARLRPGEDVELRVYANGRFHTIQLRAARASELPRHRGGFMIPGGPGAFGVFPPELPPLGLDGELISGQVREAIERAMEGANRALEGVGRGLQRTRIYFPDDMPDEAPRVQPIEPVHIEPIEPSRLRVPAPAPVTLRSALLDDRDLLPAKVAAVGIAEMPVAARAKGSALDIAGLRMVAVGSELATYLGPGTERGLLVIDVPPWARGALRAGDVVLRVDGRDVRPSPDEVTVAIPRLRDAQLDILRERVQHSVTLPARR